MTLGLDKCARIVMRCGKLTKGGDLVNSDGQRIKEHTVYKYLGIIEVDGIRGHEVKNQVKR
jgi:hypothetical protein